MINQGFGEAVASEMSSILSGGVHKHLFKKPSIKIASHSGSCCACTSCGEACKCQPCAQDCSNCNSSKVVAANILQQILALSELLDLNGFSKTAQELLDVANIGDTELNLPQKDNVLTAKEEDAIEAAINELDLSAPKDLPDLSSLGDMEVEVGDVHSVSDKMDRALRDMYNNPEIRNRLPEFRDDARRYIRLSDDLEGDFENEDLDTEEPKEEEVEFDVNPDFSFFDNSAYRFQDGLDDDPAPNLGLEVWPGIGDSLEEITVRPGQRDKLATLTNRLLDEWLKKNASDEDDEEDFLDEDLVGSDDYEDFVDVTTKEDAARVMMLYHSGQFDPIYMVASYFISGKDYPDLDVVSQALGYLERDLDRRDKLKLTESEAHELGSTIDFLKLYLKEKGYSDEEEI